MLHKREKCGQRGLKYIEVMGEILVFLCELTL